MGGRNADSGSDQNGLQIRGKGSFSQGRDGGLKFFGVDPAVVPRDFLEAGHLEALMMLNGADELGGFQERLMGSGVEPGEAAAEDFGVEVAALTGSE